MKIEFSLDFNDYMAFQESYIRIPEVLKKEQRKNIRQFCFYHLLVISFCILEGFLKIPQVGIYLGVFMSVILIFSLVFSKKITIFFSLHTAERNFSKKEFAAENYGKLIQCEFGHEEIKYKTEGIEVIYQNSSIKRVFETEKHFFLYLGSDSALIIPLTTLDVPEPELEQLKATLRAFHKN